MKQRKRLLIKQVFGKCDNFRKTSAVAGVFFYDRRSFIVTTAGTVLFIRSHAAPRHGDIRHRRNVFRLLRQKLN